MNFKKLFTTGFVFVLFLLVGLTNAQTTYYVNSQTGSDGWNGKFATDQGDGIGGPKLTLQDAIDDAVAGDIIEVKNTPVNYTEATVTVNKDLIIKSTNGAPTFTGIFDIQSDVEFQGDFNVATFQLNTASQVDWTSGALTVTGAILVADAAAVFNDTDGTLVASTATLDYTVAFSTGDEFPTTGVTDLTTGAGNVDMNGNHTITGDLTVGAGGLDLTTDILTISGASLLHALAGDVTNGTVAFDMTGATTISGTGVEDLPDITATAAAAALLTIANSIEDVGDVIINGAADLLAQNDGVILDVTNNGTEDIVVSNDNDAAGDHVQNVTLNGSGDVTLDDFTAGQAHVVGGNLLVTGTGTINYGANTNNLTVDGNVSITTSIDISAAVIANAARIIFSDDPTTVNGTVTNSFDMTGTASGAGNDGNGLIQFLAAANNVALADVINEATGDPVDDGSAGDSDNNGNIEFAFVGVANTFMAGDITNSSSFTNDATNSGLIYFTAAVLGDIAVDVVTNSSSTDVAGNGNVDFNVASTGDFTADALSSTGADGGDILLPNSTGVGNDLNVNGNVTNSRTVAGSDIIFGDGTGLAVTITGDVSNVESEILFDVAGAAVVAINGTITNSGGGTIDLSQITTGAIGAGANLLNGVTVSDGLVNMNGFDGSGITPLTLGAVNVSGGLLDVTGITNACDLALTTLTLSGGEADFNSTAVTNMDMSGNVSLTDGTLDLTGINNFTTNGTQITLGDADSNPTILPAWNAGFSAIFILDQAFPNVVQTINIGANFPEWPGQFDCTNPAGISPLIQFTGGNLRIMGDLNFTNPNVDNAIVIDGAKLYLGNNAEVGSGGNFDNSSGYLTENGGRVVMSGDAVQAVTVGGAGIYFGGFEVDNSNGGVVDVTLSAAGFFYDFFYLAQGTVDGADVNFVSYNSSVPHIVRNKGDFDAQPIFADPVDVTYIGLDQITALELPDFVTYPNELRNLTVSTTNSLNVPGRGVIQLANDIQVNGILTVDPLQTLYLNNNELYMAGTTVNVNGDIAADAGDFFTLTSATGVQFVGDGFIPSIMVNDNSQGNVIGDNIAGIVDDLLGTNAIRGDVGGGVDDETTDGDIAFEDAGAGVGAGPSDLTITFPALVAPAVAHFDGLTLGDDDDETFTLGSDAVMSGDIATAGGVIDLGGFALTSDGGNFDMDEAAEITNGTLEFTNTLLIQTTWATNPPSIAADVLFNAPGFVQTLDDNMELVITGDVTLMNDGLTPVVNGTTVNLNDGSILTLAGLNATIEEVSNVTSADVANDGLLLLDVAPPNAALNLSSQDGGIDNLEVADAVNLTGVDLTTMNFTHTDGLFNFGSVDFEVTNSYDRTAGTYDATTGFFIWNAATQDNFNHGATDITIPNVYFQQDAEFEEAGNLTVTGELRIADDLQIDPAADNSSGAVIVGDATNVGLVHLTGPNADATFDALTFGNANADFLFDGNSFTVNTSLWPAAPSTVARNVEVDMAAAGQEAILTDSRYIGTMLTLSKGNLVWDETLDIELPAGATIFVVYGILDNDDDGDGTDFGTLTAPSINLTYDNNLVVGYNTGLEYTEPTSLATFTLENGFSPADTYVIIDDARTIDGVVTLNSVLDINANTTFTLPLTIGGNATVNVDPTLIGGITATLTGGVTIDGTLNNNATVTSPADLDVNATGTYYDAGFATTFVNVVNDGAFNSEDNSVLNISGNISGAGAFNFNLAGVAVNLLFTTLNHTGSAVDFSNATLVNTNNLSINFLGGTPVAFTLPGNTTIANLTINLTTNDIVSVDGGNLTINDGAAPNTGVLTLNKGLLDGTDNNIIVNLGFAALGGFNYLGATNIVRNLADPVNDLSHVIGSLAVNTPVAAVGRIDFPVGSADAYRPAAVEFTTVDPVETASMISVGHVDGEAQGNTNLPLDGGQKFQDASLDNPIGGKAPYYWAFTANPSLGVLQKYNLELQADGINKPFDNVYNLRTIGRANGQVTTNAWFIQGENTGNSNILQLNTPGPGDSLIYVRAENSTGWLVPQATYFTIGVPTQPPIWAVGGTPADAAINEGDTYTFTYQATNLDANPAALVYSVDAVTPALDPTMYSIDGATGLFTFTPDFTTGTNAYTFTVMATKSDDANSFVTDQVVITVNNVNQAPTFVGDGTATVATGDVNSGDTFNFTYAAVDPDAGDVLTYAIQDIAPAFAGTATISATLGTFEFTPDFADAGQTFTVTITATDAGLLVATTTTDITVGYPVDKGDVDADGDVDIDDAQLVLEHVVGNALLTDPQELWAADINDDALYTAVDASRILYFWAYGSFPTWKLSATAASVEFGQFRNEDNLITLPINITNANGVLTFYTEVNLGTELEFVGVAKTQGEGWISSSKFENGTLKFVMIGTESLNDGAVAAISVRLKDKEAAIQINASANLNDENSIELNAINLREIPTEFALKQNYPNPFNPTTTIKYAIPENAHVTLVVYDMLGQVVRKLVDTEQEAGFYTMQWDGSSEYGSRVASGIYIYRITAGKYTSTLKMNLLK